MTTQTIQAKNLGPITEATITLEGHGVTILSAANGSGKSILLEAMQAAARGKGRVPLRDGTRRGSLDACGAHITIGAATRHSGEFEVLSLEGRFDLAELVDPQLVDPKAADKKRIKALVSLTGATADPARFTVRPEFGGKEAFESIVPAEALQSSDLVELAAKVKAAYEAEARQYESTAQHELAHERACRETVQGVDITAEHDATTLQAAYDAAHDRLSRLEQQRRAAAEVQDKTDKARWRLTQIRQAYTGPTVEEATAAAEIASNAAMDIAEDIRAAEATLATLRADQQRITLELERANERVEAAKQFAAQTDELEALVSGEILAAPKPSEIEEAAEAAAQAQKAVELGVRVRDAIERHAEAAKHRGAAQQSTQQAQRMRTAAAATEEVLSEAIQCESLRIEIEDGAPRLVCDHPVRGKSIPYHELSDGERWRIAIDLGAARVGENGLLVIPQVAWESIDAWVRPEIHQRAIERKVYVLTAEATRDKAEGRELKAKRFEGAT